MSKYVEDMKKRNISKKFLDLQNYMIQNTKKVNETQLIDDIRSIHADMIVIVVCYSQILDLKFLLEESGILSETRVVRDLCIQSRGKILTMSQKQKEFLQTVAKPENITKRLIQIQGQVGSGKTLLGIEVVKMKVAHYLRLHGLNAEEGKEQIRVIVVIEFGESDNLKLILEDELLEDIAKQASLEIHNGGLLKKIIETPKGFVKFKKSILLVDECGIEYMASYTVKDLEEKLSIDYIHCIRYSDFCKKSKILREKIQVEEEGIFVTLLQMQRSSQPILELTYFINRHHDDYLNVLIHDSPDSKNSFNGPKPQWIEVKDAKAFVKYAEENLSAFKGDAMVIKEVKGEELSEISLLCSKFEWKYCDREDVRGSESTLVIIYDFDEFDFEAFTRAKHNLLIVTLSNKR